MCGVPSSAAPEDTLRRTTGGLILGGIGLVLAGAIGLAQPAAGSHAELVNRYCVTCHNGVARTAELLLDPIDVEKVGSRPRVWEKVLRRIRAGEMPPPGMPRPDAARLRGFTDYLEKELDRASLAHPDPGRPAIHRLNRTEYANAIRDILALEIDGRTLLPAEDSGYGFDNMADVLTLSPVLLEGYLAAARRISRLAVGDPSLPPLFQGYDLPPTLVQKGRMGDDLPFGSRGGASIRHYFPLDGEYLIRVRLQRGDEEGDILGIERPVHLDLRLDGQRVRLFQVGGRFKPSPVPTYLRVEPDPAEALYARTADEVLEVRVSRRAGTGLVGVTFLKDTAKEEGVLRRGNPSPFEGVASVSIGGPYDPRGPGDTPSRREVFICRPAVGEEEACARKILARLARRAYRRPISEADLAGLLIPFRQGRDGGGFEAGIRLALQRILVAPEFLFRIERDPPGLAPGTVYPISDLELASRLSFFLWSSPPDQELLGLAERGELKVQAVLEGQVGRLLRDPRSRTLVTNFVGQWLYLRNIETVLPDPKIFPEFDENLRQALRRETELFVGSTLREDRSVLELLEADYTFVNQRLARHYGMAGIHGSDFRRVKLRDEARRGLLGQGSILTVTSYANRTSPTLRGKWVLENLLGSPPPPSPPDAPSLSEEKGRDLSMRERLEMHRGNPACATCHARMDSLGFALENFDGLGRWRDAGAGGSGIDASGALPDGTRFEGPAGLREVLSGRRGEFVLNLTERLLTYALGRGVEYYDLPAVRRIVREAARENHRWSALISGVVRSLPFRMRRTAAP